MERLEERLKELGYRKDYEFYQRENITLLCYEKCKYKYSYIQIAFYKETNKIHYHKIVLYDKEISHYAQIDEITKAFNEMQKDLAILKEIEKDELEL